MALDVVCREAGPRDGPRVVEAFVPTIEKIRWFREEAASGVSAIQVCSFVPPKLNPQFADVAEVARASLEIDSLDVSPRQDAAGATFEAASGLSTAFGCTLEGAVPPRDVIDPAGRNADAGT